jgi:hypothetical protein
VHHAPPTEGFHPIEHGDTSSNSCNFLKAIKMTFFHITVAIFLALLSGVFGAGITFLTAQKLRISENTTNKLVKVGTHTSYCLTYGAAIWMYSVPVATTWEVVPIALPLYWVFPILVFIAWCLVRVSQVLKKLATMLIAVLGRR